MSYLAVAYIFLCLGFCLGFAASTVLTMHLRAGREDRRADIGGHQPRADGGSAKPSPGRD